MLYLRRSLAGLFIGLIIGVLFTLFLRDLPLAGAEGNLKAPFDPLGGLAMGAIIGGAYALLFSPDRNSSAESAANGLILGVIAWVALRLIGFPALLAGGSLWQASDARLVFPGLLAAHFQGGLTGLVYSQLCRLFASRLRLTEPTPEAPKITKRVIIIGGGYAGVSAAQALERELAGDPSVGIWLLSQKNYLLHTPMLSEVSSSAVNAQNISPPLRSFFDRTQVVLCEVADVDLEKSLVHIAEDARNKARTLPFDHLLLTVGGVANFFGNEAVAAEAFTFKSLQDAMLLRNQIIDMFERADVEPDAAKRQRMLTFVVAGGGFAGIELIGGLNDFARGILRFYPNIPLQEVRTILVHSRDAILPELSPSLAEFAREKLAERGIEFKLGVRVTGAEHGAVHLGEDLLPTETFVWTAGNKPSPIISMLGLPLTKRGQLEVTAELAATTAPNVWAAGDCAQIPDLITGKFCPPTAQHALREGKVAGYNIAATLKDKPLKPFRYKSLGSLAALGHQLAVAEVMGRRFSGLLAWLMWRSIYLSKLPTLDKQVRVGLDWFLDVFFPADIVQTVDFSRPSADQRLQARQSILGEAE